MAPDQRDELDQFLFDQGEGELVNIKFLPGRKPDMTSSEFRQEAASALKEAAARDPNDPPHSGRKKTEIEEFVAQTG